MVITPEYREMNRHLHKTRPSYGKSGHKWAHVARKLVREYGSKDVLDYGCGKGTLCKAMDHRIREYDPAIPGKDKTPTPADIVVCTDVLEHIEPELLDNVLRDLRRLTNRAALFVVATRAAKKSLPDGRNAHLIQESDFYWKNRISEYFNIVHFETVDQGDVMIIAEPK